MITRIETKRSLKTSITNLYMHNNMLQKQQQTLNSLKIRALIMEANMKEELN